MRTREGTRSRDGSRNFYALTSLPLRRQVVQTRSRLVAPFTFARTGRRFTFQRRLVTLCAWLMLFPNCGPLPHISQTCAMTAPDGIRSRLVKHVFYRIWESSASSQDRSWSFVVGRSRTTAHTSRDNARFV